MPPVEGIRAISPILVPKVDRSSCCSQAARSSHLHCVQNEIAMRGSVTGAVKIAVVAIALVLQSVPKVCERVECQSPDGLGISEAARKVETPCLALALRPTSP